MTVYHTLSVILGTCCSKLCSASRGLLDFPRFNMSNYGRCAFSFAGPHTWNLLPDQLQPP